MFSSRRYVVCFYFRPHACSVMSDSATPWTRAHQAPLAMEFSRQECWSGFPFPIPGDLSDPEIKPTSLLSPTSAGRFFPTVLPGNCVSCDIGSHVFGFPSVTISSVHHLLKRFSSLLWTVLARWIYFWTIFSLIYLFILLLILLSGLL